MFTFEQEYITQPTKQSTNMNIQILPNWCKKIGALAFIVFTLLTISDDLRRGWNSVEDTSPYNKQIESPHNNHGDNAQGDTHHFYFGKETSHLFMVLSYVGLFAYMLSKEKVEDDYINKLRLESYQLSVLLFIILSLVIFVFFKDLKLTFDYFLESFMLLYLIIFFFKKRIY